MSTTLWPEGQYTGNIISAEFTSAKTGTPQMKIIFDVQGSTRTMFMPLTDKCLGYADDGRPNITQQALDALRYNNDDPPTFGVSENVPLYMKHDTYNGTVRERWNVSTGGPSRPPPSGTVDQFLAKMRAIRSAAPLPPAPAKKPAPAPAKPSSPPPAAPPPQPPASGMTKDEAWARWEAAGVADRNKWFAAIREIDKPESRFTPADWETVADRANLPF